MPSQLRESVARLWAPLSAFLACLCWPLAVAGCWAWVRLSGAVLGQIWSVLWPVEDEYTGPQDQESRKWGEWLRWQPRT
jgi:hypothetical protein